MGQVLVIRGGALGDFLLTLPAVRMLKQGLPKAAVEVLGYRPIIDLAVKAGAADRVRSIEHAPLARFFVPGAELDKDWCAYFQSFDVIFTFLHDPEGIFRANLERTGAQTIFQGAWKVSDDPAEGHATEQLAHVCQRLALFLEDPAPVLRPPRPAYERRGLAIHPGSGSPRKNWPRERWAEAGPLLARLVPSGEELVVVSGEAEDEWIDEWLRDWRGLPVRHLRHAPLGDLADILAGCRAFVGHDTGITHLAAACGIPSLVLFGPTDPRVWAPRNPNCTAFRAPGGRLEALRAADVVPRVAALLVPAN